MDMKKIREKLNLTQQEIANLLGVSLSTFRYWESGEHEPSRMAMEKIKKFLKHKGIKDEK